MVLCTRRNPHLLEDLQNGIQGYPGNRPDHGNGSHECVHLIVHCLVCPCMLTIRPRLQFVSESSLSAPYVPPSHFIGQQFPSIALKLIPFFGGLLWHCVSHQTKGLVKYQHYFLLCLYPCGEESSSVLPWTPFWLPFPAEGWFGHSVWISLRIDDGPIGVRRLLWEKSPEGGTKRDCGAHTQLMTLGQGNKRCS